MAVDRPTRLDIEYPRDDQAKALQRFADWAGIQAPDIQASTKRSINAFNIRPFVWRAYNRGWSNPTHRARRRWDPPCLLASMPPGFDAETHLCHGPLLAAPQQPQQSQPHCTLPSATPEVQPKFHATSPVTQSNFRASLDMGTQKDVRFSFWLPTKRQPLAQDQLSWPCFQALTNEQRKVYDEYHDTGVDHVENVLAAQGDATVLPSHDVLPARHVLPVPDVQPARPVSPAHGILPAQDSPQADLPSVPTMPAMTAPTYNSIQLRGNTAGQKRTRTRRRQLTRFTRNDVLPPGTGVEGMRRWLRSHNVTD